MSPNVKKRHEEKDTILIRRSHEQASPEVPRASPQDTHILPATFNDTHLAVILFFLSRSPLPSSLCDFVHHAGAVQTGVRPYITSYRCAAKVLGRV